MSSEGNITVIESFSADDTHALGVTLGQQAKPGDVCTLVGDLGVGKTVLTQGIAEGLGITEPINSPTFTIVQVYEEGRLPFYHFDVYRIGDIEEMDEIGYEDYFYGDGLTMIEWANLIEEILPKKRKEITIEKDLEKGFDYRKIMKILALDSSGLVASVAVVSDDNLIGEYTINYKKTHSQTLLPMLDEVAKMTELDLKTIDFIAVSAGPGSFTGLRIGSATAKGLALALDKQIVSVPTVDALAYNLWGSADVVCPLMDARRQQTYTGLYDFTDGRMNTILPQCVVMIEEIVDQINELGRRVIFLGDGVDVFRDYINEHVKVDYDFAPAMCNKQRASAVACLGQVLYEQGRAENAADHKPEYLRLSQAERERQEKERDFRI